MDPCQDLADLVAQLKVGIQNLQLQLMDPTTPPDQLAQLSGQLFQARRNLIEAEKALQNCRQHPPPPPPFPTQAYLKASNTRENAGFGYSVAVSGNTLVIGSPYESSGATGVDGNQADTSVVDAGAVYVFVRENRLWRQQAYLKASNTAAPPSPMTASQHFGYSVAISGDTIVVGALGEASAASGVNGDQTDRSANLAGAAYVFVRVRGVWSQQAYLKPSNTAAGQQFGDAVAISGDTIAVAACGESSNARGVNGNQTDTSAFAAGAVYVFVRSGTIWSQQAYLKASNTAAFQQFGFAVAISGDTVVVGANGESSNATGVNGNQADNSAPAAGAAYVFVRSHFANGIFWTQEAYLKASNAAAHQNFGVSVAASGDTLVVGAHFESSNALGVNGNQADTSSPGAGAAYVFVRSPLVNHPVARRRAINVGPGNLVRRYFWVQQAYLKASQASETLATDLVDGANFGWSVAISGDVVIAGIPQQNFTITDGQGNSAVASCGAADVFRRNANGWAPLIRLIASNATGVPEPPPYSFDGVAYEQEFGWAVAVSGLVTAVGTWAESSAATGVNGNEFDDSASDSGAAYVFSD